MQKLLSVSVMMFVVLFFQSKVFAAGLNCKFKDIQVDGISSIEINDSSLIINSEMEIPMEKSRVNCGNFGRQTRFDGNALGYQIILKSCSSEAKLEGHLIDSINEISADVFCQPIL